MICLPPGLPSSSHPLHCGPLDLGDCLGASASSEMVSSLVRAIIEERTFILLPGICR